MNADYCQKAREKVGNPNVLVNLVSRRVRQLNAGSGSTSRPLLSDVANLGVGDIALLEILEGKMGFELVAEQEPGESPARKRRKS